MNRTTKELLIFAVIAIIEFGTLFYLISKA